MSDDIVRAFIRWMVATTLLLGLLTACVIALMFKVLT